MKSFVFVVVVAFAAFVFTPRAARADIDSGLVAYLPFDGAVDDALASARQVTPVGNPLFVPSRPGFGKGLQIRANSNAGNVAVSGIWGSDYGTIAL